MGGHEVEDFWCQLVSGELALSQLYAALCGKRIFQSCSVGALNNYHTLHVLNYKYLACELLHSNMANH